MPRNSRRAKPRLTLTVRVDAEGSYAWVETRYAAGRAFNRWAAVRQLRRQYPDACAVRVVEQWHVPFSHHAFKIRFDDTT